MFEPTESAIASFESEMARSWTVFTPPPKLTISEWADEFRRLSQIDSAEPGLWRTTRAEYLRGIMDAFNDPAIEGVVVQASAQVGKTQCLNNVAGYYIHQDPSPIMVVQPTQEDATEWAKDRFMRGMVEVTPALRALIRADRTRQNSDTIHHKQFPGGQLTVAWSNSKSRLASRPIRIVLLDEIDKYATDPGPQGDPVMRAINRSKTFWNRKYGMWSTPTLKGLSRIEKERLLGDDRRYFIPCPDCGEFFTLNFRDSDTGVRTIVWDRDKPETAHAVCPHCGACIPESKKSWMVERGKWIAQNPGRSVASFHINELYSSLGGSSWAAIAKKFLETKGDNVALQNFINETLGETWELTGDTVSTRTLLSRREVYKAQIPAFICTLAAGVDVQRDRLEVSVWGWGPGHESALIDHRIIVGNVAEDAVWGELDGLLNTSYKHELGVELPIVQTFVDSSDGVVTQKVYTYCKKRITNHVFACKGRANKPGAPLPLVERPKKMQSGAFLYTVGVDTAKGQLYSYLWLEKPGPGYVHLPLSDFCDEEFCSQLTAEKLTKTKENYQPKLEWIKIRDRNEALDCAVYARAALESRRVDLITTMMNLKRRASEMHPKPPEPIIVGEIPAPIIQQQQRSRTIQRRTVRNNWVTGY